MGAGVADAMGAADVEAGGPDGDGTVGSGSGSRPARSRRTTDTATIAVATRLSAVGHVVSGRYDGETPIRTVCNDMRRVGLPTPTDGYEPANRQTVTPSAS